LKQRPFLFGDVLDALGYGSDYLAFACRDTGFQVVAFIHDLIEGEFS
jgi:hypothetical protein